MSLKPRKALGLQKKGIDVLVKPILSAFDREGDNVKNLVVVTYKAAKSILIDGKDLDIDRGEVKKQ